MSRTDDSAAVDLKITPLTDRPGLAVAGDVDFRSLAEFTEAIADLTQCDSGDIYIDLARVTFIEVSGMRVLADAARRLAEQDRRLVLENLAPHLQPVLKVVGWYGSSDSAD